MRGLHYSTRREAIAIPTAAASPRAGTPPPTARFDPSRTPELAVPTPWLWTPAPAARPQYRLLAVPYAAGGPFSYLHWTRLLPDHVELQVVSAPGRDLRDDEPEESRLDACLDAIAREVLDQPPLPLVLFGHSLGALVAYGLAARLEAIQRGARHLVVSGKAPPGRGRDDLVWRDLDDLALLGAMSARFGGVPDEVAEDEELRAVVASRLRNDLALLESANAQPTPALSTPVTVLAGVRDASVTPSELGAWDSLAVTPPAYHSFDDGHFFIVHRAEAVLQRLGTLMPRRP